MAEFRKFSCDQCPKIFVRPSELERHWTDVHHPLPLWLWCDRCLWGSKHRSSLIRHVAGRHGMGKRMSKEVADDAEKKGKERSRLVREKEDERKMTKMMELESRTNYEDYMEEIKLEEDEQEPEAVEHSIDLLCFQFSKIKIN